MLEHECTEDDLKVLSRVIQSPLHFMAGKMMTHHRYFFTPNKTYGRNSSVIII